MVGWVRERRGEQTLESQQSNSRNVLDSVQVN